MSGRAMLSLEQKPFLEFHPEPNLMNLLGPWTVYHWFKFELRIQILSEFLTLKQRFIFELAVGSSAS